MRGKLKICEFARVTNDGLQYDAIGVGTSFISVSSFPASVAFTLLVENEFEKTDVGNEYPFEIKIVDMEGKDAGPAVTGSILPRNKTGIAYSAFNIQILIKNYVILKFTLLINGEENDKVLLEIKAKDKSQKI